MKLKQNEAFPGPKVGLQAPGEEELYPTSASFSAELVFPGTERGHWGGVGGAHCLLGNWRNRETEAQSGQVGARVAQLVGGQAQCGGWQAASSG